MAILEWLSSALISGLIKGRKKQPEMRQSTARPKSLREIVAKQKKTLFQDANQLEATDPQAEKMLNEAKLSLQIALRDKSYSGYLKAVDLFKRIAYLPAARSFYVNELISKADIPIFQRISNEMLGSPEFFARTASVSKYHFLRYLTPITLDVGIAHQRLPAANDIHFITVPAGNINSAVSE